MVNDSKVLLRLQLRIIKIVVAAGILTSWIAGVSQIPSVLKDRDRAGFAVNRVQFYNVIAGRESGNVPTTINHLGRDLRELIGPTDAPAVELPAAVNSFRGNPNVHGGVSSELGFNPFDDARLGCTECGRLTLEMKSKLLTIKRGGVDDLITSEGTIKKKGFTLTPFGWSIIKTLLVFWLIGGSLILALAFSLARATNPRFRTRKLGELDWSLKSGDGAGKIFIALLAPLWFIAAKIWRSRHVTAVRTKYGYFYTEIAEIDKQLSAAKAIDPDSREVKELTAGRNEVVSEFERVMGSASKQKVSLDGVRERLSVVRDTLDAYHDRYGGGGKER